MILSYRFAEKRLTPRAASQFMGINTSITTGPPAERQAAVEVFGGITTVNIGNAKCFFSPDADGWNQILSALQSHTTTMPSVHFDPKCFSDHRQLVYTPSVSTNVDGSGAPSFIFEQWRTLTDPAVIEVF